MVFNFKRKTIIIASVVCIGVCGAIGGTVAGIYCTGQYTVSDMQTESLSQSTSAESIQESAGESNVEESVQSQTTESQTEEKKEFIVWNLMSHTRLWKKRCKLTLRAMKKTRK
ncbi:MAG: hypothetical protein ACLR13_08065 [Acutalibacteraceae bacterium]